MIESWYYSQYPDVKKSGIGAIRHWLRYGYFEGRWLIPPVWYGKATYKHGWLRRELKLFDLLTDNDEKWGLNWKKNLKVIYYRRWEKSKFFKNLINDLHQNSQVSLKLKKVGLDKYVINYLLKDLNRYKISHSVKFKNASSFDQHINLLEQVLNVTTPLKILLIEGESFELLMTKISFEILDRHTIEIIEPL